MGMRGGRLSPDYPNVSFAFLTEARAFQAYNLFGRSSTIPERLSWLVVTPPEMSRSFVCLVRPVRRF